MDPDPQNSNHLLRRATICKLAIRSLRNTNEDKYKDFYMDYHTFLQNSDCKILPIWVPTLNRVMDQPVVFCPLRSSFIPVNIENELQIQNSNFIAAFPKTNEKIMIFNLISNPEGIQSCELLKINKVYWNKKQEIEGHILSIPVPRSCSQIQLIFNTLKDFTVHLYENR